VTVMIALAALVIPAAAQAKIPVGGATRAEILYATVGDNSSHDQCYGTYLASRGSPWALQTTPTSDYRKAACRQIQAGGFGILNYSGGRWHVVSEADYVSCPFLSRPHEPAIPSTILRELTGHYCSQLPRTITGYTVSPQFKPYLITTTGDGSGFYGGRTGQTVVPPSGRATGQLGRLRWTQYSAISAHATGLEWDKSGPGDTADQSYHVGGAISLYEFRPEYGVFTRLQVSSSYHGRHYVQTFNDDGGYWSLPGE
jgi:hypothetical protein